MSKIEKIRKAIFHCENIKKNIQALKDLGMNETAKAYQDFENISNDIDKIQLKKFKVTLNSDESWYWRNKRIIIFLGSCFVGHFYNAPFLFNEVTKNLKSAFPDFVKKNLKSAFWAVGIIFFYLMK